MKQNILLTLCLAIGVSLSAKNTPITQSNYELPARFTHEAMEQLIHSTEVVPHFLKNGNDFWYKFETAQGAKWYLVNGATGSKKELFDITRMAAQVSEITRDPYDAQHLPIKNFLFADDGKSFIFEITSSQDMTKEERTAYDEYRQISEMEDEKMAKKQQETPIKKSIYLKYDCESGLVSELPTYQKPYRNPYWASVSPDGETVIFARSNNLYCMDKANFEKALKNEKDSTIVEHQLTTDGLNDFSWGGSSYNMTNVEAKKRAGKRARAYVVWSPDAKHFLVERADERKVEELWVIHNTALPRPELESYKYQMPGDKNFAQYHLYLFDVATKGYKEVDVASYKDQTLSIQTKKQKLADRELINRKPTEWLGDNQKFYLSISSRDMKRIDLCSVDITADSLAAKTLIKEQMNTSIESRRIELINNGKEIIQWSQRSGWAQLYLYDAESGELKHPITSGDYHIESVVGYDEASRTAYFIANGYDKEDNPYYTQLFKVNIDGGTPVQLTESGFESTTVLGDNHNFFLNTYSRVDTTPESVLCSTKGGKVTKHLETADLSNLFATGYKFPERFKVKAADGITDLYGVMYKPYDFDSTKLYPIIEYVYPGPQTEAVDVKFEYIQRAFDRVDRLAQFGFIVVTVGNRGGSPQRSKWYHNYGYGNLRDYGLADKKATVEQLADRFDFIDRTRVGIHGHSGGGFMSTAAILTYPDFFKVAVSCAGNHQNNIYNSWWSEKHHGVKEVISEKGDTTFQYAIDKNADLAKNLKGNLLLIHGDVDNNVHPANTLTVVDALIKANKRFDMLILPGQQHAFGDMTEYFFWRMGDYFSRHLIGDSETSTDIPQLSKQ